MLRNSKKHLILIFKIVTPILLFGAGFYVGDRYSDNFGIQKLSSISNKEPALPVTADFAPFWKTWNLINEKFVDGHASSTGTTTAAYKAAYKPVSDQEKIYGAISGLVKSLGDPYTTFLPPNEAEMFQNDINGSFQGVGMEVGLKSDLLTVIAPLEGTPAKKAGIRSGDKIVKIDDKSTVGMSVEEAVKMIRGPRGTSVTLSILREGEKDILTIKVTRDTITIPVMDIGESKSVGKDGSLRNGKGGTVSDENNNGLRKDGIFVMRLYNFSAPSPDFFREALKKFEVSGSNKLILDLRGNPGGFLEAAVEISSWFLPSDKVVVREVINKEGDEKIHRSKGYDIFNENLKMAILIDKGSASASEILAGALSEHGVAKLIGEQSFGKGSVQELISVTSDTYVKMTIAKWLTPGGKSISLSGLTPDIIVPITKEDVLKGNDPQMDRAAKLLLEGK
ncbi:MAG: S41 family peptidase [bacterium]|nr:S41 family peptidase [bacterium]